MRVELLGAPIHLKNQCGVKKIYIIFAFKGRSVVTLQLSKGNFC